MGRNNKYKRRKKDMESDSSLNASSTSKNSSLNASSTSKNSSTPAISVLERKHKFESMSGIGDLNEYPHLNSHKNTNKYEDISYHSTEISEIVSDGISLVKSFTDKVLTSEGANELISMFHTIEDEFRESLSDPIAVSSNQFPNNFMSLNNQNKFQHISQCFNTLFSQMEMIKETNNNILNNINSRSFNNVVSNQNTCSMSHKFEKSSCAEPPSRIIEPSLSMTNTPLSILLEPIKDRPLPLSISDSKLQKTTVHKIFTKESGIQVSYLAETKQGGLKIGFPNTSIRKNALDTLNKNINNTNLKPVLLDKILPRVTVPYISNQVDPDDLIDDILARNKPIRDLYDGGDILEKIFTAKRNDNYYDAVLKCSPRIRELILQSKLFVGLSSLKAYDRFYIQRCQNCLGFYHKKSECTKPFICKYGCINHDATTTCPISSDTDKHSCTNCKNSSKTEIKSKYDSHHGVSSTCPIYIDLLNKKKQNTTYDLTITGVENG